MVTTTCQAKNHIYGTDTKLDPEETYSLNTILYVNYLIQILKRYEYVSSYIQNLQNQIDPCLVFSKISCLVIPGAWNKMVISFRPERTGPIRLR